MENEKCPCCGGNRDSGFAAESFSCIDCMFMCEARDLPRIAAAMDLARAEVKHKDNPGHISELHLAYECVLEAFGGE